MLLCWAGSLALAFSVSSPHGTKSGNEIECLVSSGLLEAAFVFWWKKRWLFVRRHLGSAKKQNKTKTLILWSSTHRHFSCYFIRGFYFISTYSTLFRGHLLQRLQAQDLKSSCLCPNLGHATILCVTLDELILFL